LERLALTLERNASWAAQEGDGDMDLVMRSVGTALLSIAGDLAASDLDLAQDVAARAISLITTFHCLYPEYPIGPTLH
jgi:hypothetical protein